MFWKARSAVASPFGGCGRRRGEQPPVVSFHGIKRRIRARHAHQSGFSFMASPNRSRASSFSPIFRYV